MIYGVAMTCLPAVPPRDLRQTVEAGRPADIVPVAAPACSRNAVAAARGGCAGRRLEDHHDRGQRRALLQADLIAACLGISGAHRAASRSGCISAIPIMPPISMMIPQMT